MPLLRHISQFWQQLPSKRPSSIAMAQFIGLAIAAVALWGCYEMIESILVQQSQWIDQRVLLVLRQSPSPGVDRLLLHLSRVGEPTALGLTCALAVACLVGQQQWIPASMVAIGSMGALALNPLVQTLFPHPESVLWRQLATAAVPIVILHAATALLVYGMVGYLLARRWESWRWAIAGFTLVLVGGVGASRVALGLQGITNLLTGYTVDALWLLACLFVLNIWREPTTLTNSLHGHQVAASHSDASIP